MITIIKNQKKLPAFSILEMTVVLGITAIIMVMLSNILITSISISQRSLVRSFVREEITSVADAIASDIKSSNQIENCIGDISNINCEVVTDSKYTWTTCPGTRPNQVRICKLNEAGSEVFVSSDNLNFKVFSIEPGFEEGESKSRKNLLVTISADHVLEGLNVQNIFKQASISSRNYLLVGGGTPSQLGGICGVTSETITVTFPNIPGRCSNNSGGSGGRVVRGYKVTSQSVSIGTEVCSLSGTSIATTGARFTYDDSFLLAINDAILVASSDKLYNVFPEVTPGISQVNTPGTLLGVGFRSRRDPPKCIGNITGSSSNSSSSCFVPKSDTNSAGFGFNVSSDLGIKLGNYLRGSNSFRIDSITVGNNNDNSDCSMGGFTVDIIVDSVPTGCGCPVIPVCGNGIVESSNGEHCDDGNLNDSDSCSNDCSRVARVDRSFANNDCWNISCPASEPYFRSGTAQYSGRDGKRCVAWNGRVPDRLYLKEGENCGAGSVRNSSILCTSKPNGSTLNQFSGANRRKSSPSQCPQR